MKKHLLATAAAVLLSAGAAQADTYVSLLGGPTWAPSLNVGGTNRSMDTGFNAGGRVGYYLGNWNLPNVSVEADGLFTQSKFTNGGDARIQSSSYMGNVIYHLPLSDLPFGVSLYGGAGLGAVNTNIDNAAGRHGGSTVLGWQALGGVEYPTSPNSNIFIEYRYQNAHDVNAGGFSPVGDTTNNLSVGVKWHL